MATAIGSVAVATRGGAVAQVRLPGREPADVAMNDEAPPAVAAAIAGALTGQPAPLKLALEGTPFQRAVWEAIAAIPAGETTTYGAIARALGRPGAARAVGAACGRNPVPLLIPCHRVVASDGGLGGFTGGLHIKRALLARERAAG